MCKTNLYDSNYCDNVLSSPQAGPRDNTDRRRYTVHRSQARGFTWATADCQPPCQNRGSCSRPHTCVCRSGFQGPRCEEVAPEQVYIREGGALRRVHPGTSSFQRDQPRRRPSERQAIDSTKVQTPRPPTTRQPV
ncbi:unnamed protein product [Pleuronectes platessa]|uniref:EGF-like domain-containing protein n=1 Tax=Pleuronectes platessa TaxID=8262 RepID=A0A9N7YLP1_PLEPL|nr:unnamed protein product [Pleuronectes platessa]